MANLTFSKKGKPMGRSKAVKEGQKRRWTPEEDNYLRIALEEGKDASTVAARLGRSRFSVTCRKSELGIEGRFARARKSSAPAPKTAPKASPARPKKTVATLSGPDGLQLMVLETNVPLPSKATKNDEAREKIRGLLKEMKVGNSFVVPRKLVHVATYVASREFEDYKLRTSATSPEKQFYRIFRLA